MDAHRPVSSRTAREVGQGGQPAEAGRRPARKVPVGVWLGGGLGALAYLALFYETLADLVGVWAVSATYGYGFLIPPVAVYLAFRRRHRLAGMAIQPSLLGVVAAIAAGAIWFLGALSDVDVLRHLGVVGILQAIIVAVIGLKMARQLALPLAYLLLAVPLADGLIEPLQWLTADYTVALVRLTGVPVHLDGWFLTIPGGTFHVAEACAGVRYLIACIAFGVVAADVFFSRAWKRWAFVAISALVPIGANVLRAYGIVMLAHLSDFKVAVGVDHLIYGGIFLSMVTLVLVLIAVLMRDRGYGSPTVPSVPRASAPPEHASATRPGYPVVLTLLIVALVAFRAYAGVVASPAGPAGPVTLAAPSVAGWTSGPPRSSWQPAFPTADVTGMWRYTRQDKVIEVFVARYAPLRPGVELVATGNDLAAGEETTAMARGRWRDAPSGNLPPPGYVRLRADRTERLIWYWYVVGTRLTSRPWEAKATRLALQLTGPVDGAVFAVSTEAGPEAPARLSAFMTGIDLHRAVR